MRILYLQFIGAILKYWYGNFLENPFRVNLQVLQANHPIRRKVRLTRLSASINDILHHHFSVVLAIILIHMDILNRNLITSRFFHYHVLDESICHYRAVLSILSVLFYFRREILLANTVYPDQTPHDVMSNLGLHYLPMALLQVSR